MGKRVNRTIEAKQSGGYSTRKKRNTLRTIFYEFHCYVEEEGQENICAQLQIHRSGDRKKKANDPLTIYRRVFIDRAGPPGTVKDEHW